QRRAPGSRREKITAEYRGKRFFGARRKVVGLLLASQRLNDCPVCCRIDSVTFGEKATVEENGSIAFLADPFHPLHTLLKHARATEMGSFGAHVRKAGPKGPSGCDPRGKFVCRIRVTGKGPDPPTPAGAHPGRRDGRDAVALRVVGEGGRRDAGGHPRRVAEVHVLAALAALPVPVRHAARPPGPAPRPAATAAPVPVRVR
ncbi:hypothetical protein ACFT0E_31515, partial [Streptomyces sp. NPDC057052]